MGLFAAMDLSNPAVTAALIGASATVLTALIQLRMSWRRELRERERGQPITKKTRRGPVMAVFALMIAAGVGGFALSQYFVSLREGDRDTLRSDLQAKLSEINATAMRLEQARTTERAQIESEIHRADAERLGEEGAVASVVVAPCRPEGLPGARQECTEQTAMRVALCARVPAGASIKEVQLYTRFEDSRQGWADSRVQAGQDAGEARFSEKSSERPDDGGARQVCQVFVSWNREKSRIARILVKYAL
ncbi:MAG TPA: hypothetical protein VEF92_04505 [Burkholderiales bacterium]|nr:hypothetical protein [Burkholderiales bacterium]